MHRKIMKAKCDICVKYFRNKSDLNVHIKSKHGKKEIIQCNICGKSMKTSAFSHHLSAKHKNDGSDKLVPKCEFCEKTISSISNLKIHLISCPSKEISQTKQNETHSVVKDHICKKSFVQVTKLDSHLKIIQKNIWKHNCDFCGKPLSEMGKLKKHKNSPIFDMTNFLTETFVQAYLTKH